MTISELKALNERNGGKFFSRENMKFTGDNMRNFRVRKGAHPHTVIVTRKKALKPNVPLSSWIFNTQTGRALYQDDF